MKKYILDFRVVENTKLHDNYALLKLKPDNNEPLPDMLPGQFVEVRVDRSPGTFLRRPISINFVDSTRNELWLLIRKAGEGTRTLCDLKQGDSINLVLPLGNTFSLPDETDSNILLIGGGVGIAPMLYWGKYLKERNYTPKFLLGFRSDKDILQYEMFRQFGDVYISTITGAEEIEDVKFRWESWDAGNGYAGPRAASDHEYIKQSVKSLKQCWEDGVRGYCDYYPII